MSKQTHEVDRLNLLRFCLWAMRMQAAGIRLTGPLVMRQWNVCHATAYRWLADFFAARTDDLREVNERRSAA